MDGILISAGADKPSCLTARNQKIDTNLPPLSENRIAVNFWQELHRRRVYRLAGLYIVGAWLVIQVADMAFQAWGVPQTALRYLFIAASAMFPVALIFSWYYDFTFRGIVRTESAATSDTVDLRLKRTDYVVLTALFAVGLAILLGSADRIKEEIESVPIAAVEADRQEYSIAVLPFTNLDSNPDTGFFSDGITEEILHRLSTLRALHVLASTSSFAFRSSEESPARISEILGVHYLLQGSIRRDKNYIRVTARLIDDEGFQVWSESFERKLEGIFKIQTEIASTVSSQIINEIVPVQALPAGRTTTNMEAYSEFLVGKAFSDARTADWKNNAEVAYRRAIELDPGFAPPYAGLAMVLTVNTPMGPNWEEGRKLAEKALKLDPDLAQAHAIFGLILTAAGEPSQGAISLRRALELDSSLGNAYNWLAVALNKLGLWDEANATKNKGLSVDPLNPPLVANVSALESRAGNFDRAEQLILRLMDLPEPPAMAYWLLRGLYVDWGRLAEAVRVSKESVLRHPGNEDAWMLEQLALDYGALGMMEDTDFWKNMLLSRLPDDLDMLIFKYTLLRMRGADSKFVAELQQLASEADLDGGNMQAMRMVFVSLINIQLGNYEKGIEQMKSAIGFDVTALARKFDTGDVIFVIHRVAFALQQVGRPGDSLKILRDLETETGLGLIESDFSHPAGLEGIALHRALLKDRMGALTALQQAANLGWANYYDVVNNPLWAETILESEFLTLLKDVKVNIDRQRAMVEAVDAEQDFRAEVDRLLAPTRAAEQ